MLVHFYFAFLLRPAVKVVPGIQICSAVLENRLPFDLINDVSSPFYISKLHLSAGSLSWINRHMVR